VCSLFHNLANYSLIVHVNYEVTEQDGLDVSVHTKSICIDHEWYNWDIVGSRSIQSLSENPSGDCIFVSRENDNYAFRAICKNNTIINGPTLSRTKIMDQLVSMHSVEDNLILSWRLSADIDSIRYNDKSTEQDDGIELFFEVFVKGEEQWESAYYAKLKHAMQKVVRRSGNSLNRIYFNGRRPAYQSADRKTIVLSTNEGELAIAQMKSNISSVDDVKNALSVKTLDISKYLPKAHRERSNDYTHNNDNHYSAYSGNRFSAGRGFVYYSNNRMNDFDNTLNYFLRKQKETILQQEAYSVPPKIIVSPNGLAIAILIPDMDKLYILHQISGSWYVKMIIQREKPIQKVPDSQTNSDESSFFSKLFRSPSERQPTEARSHGRPKWLKILDAKFIDNGSAMLVLFEDVSLAEYSVALEPVPSTTTKKETQTESEEEFDILLMLLENWRLLCLLSGVITWFILNEIKIRRSIRERRAQIIQQRQRERERMEQQEQQPSHSDNTTTEDVNNNNTSNSDDSSQSTATDSSDTSTTITEEFTTGQEE
jgi:hypothetical protein